MSVRYFPCDYCSTSVCGSGPYKHCNEDCYRCWCDDKCAKKDGYDEENEDCKFCRDEDVADEELLKFLLKRAKMTRTQAISEYFKKGK